ncbi:MAG: hypothetical protein EBZ60_05825, partial [Betaproteobacteria bacterium]|nr:hypothetical protein [Betaproteobacteria bacterium]
MGFEWLNQQGDINLANGTLSNLSGSGRIYTAIFTPLPNVASGMATIGVNAGSYTDALGNPGAAGDSPQLRVDTVAPYVVAIQRGTSVSPGGQTHLDSVDFDVTFSEAMNPLSVITLQPTFAVQLNGQALTSGIDIRTPAWLQGNQYRVNVSGTALANANGRLSLVLDHGQNMQDLATNELASTPIANQQTYWLDHTAPSITAIERGTAVDSSGRTNLSTLDFLVRFSEEMDPASLLANPLEVRLNGQALSSGVEVGEPQGLGDNRYRISVSGSALTSAEGVLSLAVASAKAPTDMAGNAVLAGLPQDAATYTLDHDPPTAVLSSITDDVAPAIGPLSPGARSNDTWLELAGTNEAGAVVKVYNDSTFLGNATVTGIRWTYLANVVNGNSYNFKVTETDLAGNTSPASAGFVVISDTTAPNAPTGVTEQGATLLSDGRLSASEAQANLSLRVKLPTTGSLAVSGDVLSLLLNGQDLGTPVLQSLGNGDLVKGYVDFSVNPNLLGGDGDKTISARLQDGAGNLSGLSTALVFNLDTQASPAPRLSELGSNKLANGYINAQEAATNTTLRVDLPTTGALAVAGDKLSLILGSTTLSSIDLTASQIANGFADLTIATSQWGSDGSKVLSAILTDKAGNASAASNSLTATLDTVAPKSTAGTLLLSSDTGISQLDWVTKTASQIISGGLSANLLTDEVVKVSFDGGNTWTKAATVGGNSWNLAYTFNQSGSVQVKVSDAAGNDGSVILKNYVFDTAASNAPLLLQLGSVLQDGYLNASEAQAGLDLRVILPSAGVLAVAGDRAELLLGGGAFANRKIVSLQAQDIAAGYVSFALSKAELGSDGLKSLTATLTDIAGNTSPASNAVAFAMDTSAPSNGIASLSLSDDSGLAGDFVTNVAAQDLMGRSDAVMAAGETVRISLNEGKTWQTANSTTGSADWTLNSQNLGVGSSIWAQVIDAAGNTGPLTKQAYTLDITAPTPSLTTAILPSASSIFARSSELGQLYLVHTSVSVRNVASITAAADNLWNSANVTSANADTPLSLNGLIDGNYRLYASDVAGNLSLVSSNSMTVDSTAPPSITSMALSADTGLFDNDFITKTAAQTISGTLSQAALAGQKLRVSVNGGITWVDANTTV